MIAKFANWFSGLAKERSFKLWIFVVGLCITLSSPIYFMGVPTGLDLPHHTRLAVAFYDSIISGDFYPSWVGFTNGGLGDPSVRFYPPALYFGWAVARLVTRDWYLATLLLITGINLIGGVGVYLWATELVEKPYAVVAVVVFILSPFHSTDLYQSSMWAQYLAASVLPFVFAFIERLARQQRWTDIACLGLSLGGLVLSHVPLALIGIMAGTLYAIAVLWRHWSFRTLLCWSLGGILGAAISCMYWLPMLIELPWKSPTGVGQGEWYDYRNNFLFAASPSPMANYWLPMLLIATAFMFAPTIVLIKHLHARFFPPALVFFFSFFMATPLSRPLWDLIPPLQNIQFPWRWMAINSACLSVLCASSGPKLLALFRSRFRPLFLLLSGCLVIGISFVGLQLIRGAVYESRSEFNHRFASIYGTRTNEDFLPIWAKVVDPLSTQVLANDRQVLIANWSNEYRAFNVSAGPQQDVVLNSYFYPNWRASANGRPIPTSVDSMGLLHLAVPPEASRVEVSFVEPASTKIAGVVSIVAIFLTVGAICGRFASGRGKGPIDL